MRILFPSQLPTFCDGLTEDAPDMLNGGLASLINPANRDDLIDMMKDGFCFGMNKLSYIIQVKIVQVSLKITTYKFNSVEDIIKCRAICKNTDDDWLDYFGLHFV